MKQSKDILAAKRALLRLVGQENLEHFFAAIIRQAIDDVLNTPRTKRLLFEDLSDRPEKTFVGTRIEEIIQHELGVPRGQEFSWSTDLALPKKEEAKVQADFIPVDVKTSATPFAWMFPPEAASNRQISLLLHYNDRQSEKGSLLPGQFAVGLLQVEDSLLNQGSNRDAKRTLRSDKRDHILFLAKGNLLPNYFRRAILSNNLDFALFATGDLEEEERLRALLRFQAVDLLSCDKSVFPREVFEAFGIPLERAIALLPSLAREMGLDLSWGKDGRYLLSSI